LFRLVPNRFVPHTHALIGALVGAVAFEAMNRAFGYYISHFPTYKLVYGAFASVPIFLMWIYLSWLAILLGAVVAASLSHWRTPMEMRLSPTLQLLGALRILREMTAGMRDGRICTLQELSRSLRLAYDTLEDILGKLERAGMVGRTSGEGWLMRRDAAHITTAELLRLFVFDPASLQGKGNDDPLMRWLADSEDRLVHDAALTLQELFSREAS